MFNKERDLLFRFIVNGRRLLPGKGALHADGVEGAAVAVVSLCHREHLGTFPVLSLPPKHLPP